LHELAFLAAVKQTGAGVDVLLVLDAGRKDVRNVQAQWRPGGVGGRVETHVCELRERAELLA
jgi:hypothetical protein